MTRKPFVAPDWKKLGRAATAALDPRSKTVTRATTMALRGGNPIRDARDYLKVCAAVGLDPATQAPACDTMPAFRGRFSAPLLAGTVLGLRRARALTMEQAAREIGISAATLCRTGRGKTVTPSTLLRIAVWSGKHPNEFTTRPDIPEAEIAEVVSRLEGLSPRSQKPNENKPFHDVFRVKQGLAAMAEEMERQEAGRAEGPTGTEQDLEDGEQ